MDIRTKNQQDPPVIGGAHRSYKKRSILADLAGRSRPVSRGAEGALQAREACESRPADAASIDQQELDMNLSCIYAAPKALFRHAKRASSDP